MPKIAVIVVTHNSEKYISANFTSLQSQSFPLTQIIMVDSGSKDPSYLLPFKEKTEIIYAKPGTGFCEANNLGWRALQPEISYVLFLNPDAFLEHDFIEKALEIMKNSHCGALTGTLKGYDFDKKAPTGRIDSTGIFTTWYGKWYDRGQGEAIKEPLPRTLEEVPALCGALILGKRAAFESILLRKNEVWDESFFMYKDDIDLSCRLRKKGWKLLYAPSLIAYHGRGWSQDRKLMARKLRLYSAWNEIRVNFSRPWTLPYSVGKYAAVKLFDL